MPVLGVRDERAAGERRGDLPVEIGDDRVAAPDAQAAGRVREIVLDIDDDERCRRVVARVHAPTLPQPVCRRRAARWATLRAMPPRINPELLAARGAVRPEPGAA